MSGSRVHILRTEIFLHLSSLSFLTMVCVVRDFLTNSSGFIPGVTEGYRANIRDRYEDLRKGFLGGKQAGSQKNVPVNIYPTLHFLTLCFARRKIFAAGGFGCWCSWCRNGNIRICDGPSHTTAPDDHGRGTSNSKRKTRRLNGYYHQGVPFFRK